MELSSKSRSTFSWLATVPLGAMEPVLVLRGLCDLHHGAILPEVPEATSAADPMQGSEKRLEKTWPKLGVYNPWPMAQSGVRVEDAWIPATMEAKAKSVGRPRGSTNREAADLRHKPAKTAATASAPAARAVVSAAPSSIPSKAKAAKGPSKPSEGSLAQLAPMLLPEPGILAERKTSTATGSSHRADVCGLQDPRSASQKRRCVDWRRETFNSTFEARGSRGHLPVEGMLSLISRRNGMKWHKLACRPWRQGDPLQMPKGSCLAFGPKSTMVSTIKLFDFLRLS
ncbi:unnamed protein product [Cladocopium goreaui]|uniref:Uncharacterized protein n=1 Tax=Cladocopium goreaui TaxID=2562237 RepID=A0A9P1C2X1_9DINO|nr:unnamed protein product [Cladocopium goreaui]